MENSFVDTYRQSVSDRRCESEDILERANKHCGSVVEAMRFTLLATAANTLVRHLEKTDRIHTDS